MVKPRRASQRAALRARRCTRLTRMRLQTPGEDVDRAPALPDAVPAPPDATPALPDATPEPPDAAPALPDLECVLLENS
jgi:hypothetical protein